MCLRSATLRGRRQHKEADQKREARSEATFSVKVCVYYHDGIKTSMFSVDIRNLLTASGPGRDHMRAGMFKIVCIYVSQSADTCHISLCFSFLSDLELKYL